MTSVRRKFVKDATRTPHMTAVSAVVLGTIFMPLLGLPELYEVRAFQSAMDSLSTASAARRDDEAARERSAQVVRGQPVVAYVPSDGEVIQTVSLHADLDLNGDEVLVPDALVEMEEPDVIQVGEPNLADPLEAGTLPEIEVAAPEEFDLPEASVASEEPIEEEPVVEKPA
jgi:hypothetical protein